MRSQATVLSYQQHIGDEYEPLNGATSDLEAGTRLEKSDCTLLTAITICMTGILIAMAAASAAIGAKILKDAGHDEYSPSAAAKRAAAGAAILALPTALIMTCSGLVKVSAQSNDSEQPSSKSSELGSLLLSAACCAAAAALGTQMLGAAAGMTLAQTVAAAAIGSTILSGAELALSACCG